MDADGLGEVAIARVIADDELPQPRQNIEAVPVVRGLERLPYLTELENERNASGLQHTPHLGQRLLLARDVAQPEAVADAMKRPFRKGKRFGVALNGRKH